jgi:hypothetical protein
MKEGKLEFIRTPTLATSREAIGRMFQRFSGVARSAKPTIRARALREQSDAEVEEALDRFGF